MTKQHQVCVRRLILLIGLLLVAVVLSLCVGAVAIRPGDLLQWDGDSVAGRILRYSRLPRTCCSLLCGAALAVSGAIIQTVLNNPLAAPNIIGVNAGAGLAAALSCAFLPVFPAMMPLAAFLGALLAVLLVLAISEVTGASRTTVVLAGVAIASLLSAGIDAVVTLVPDALPGSNSFRIGGFNGVTLKRLAPPAVMIALAMAAAFSQCRAMDLLALGEDTARSLGLRSRPARLVLLTIAAALAGAAVSFSGLVGFVGLMVPHIMRRIVGSDAAPLLAGSALGGALLVTVCDTLARTLFAPFEIPVGVVLSVVGAPFFLWLLFRREGGRHD